MFPFDISLVNVICNAEDNFYVLELFCSLSNVRASMHIITSLELLGTPIAVLEQKKQMKRFQDQI